MNKFSHSIMAFAFVCLCGLSRVQAVPILFEDFDDGVADSWTYYANSGSTGWQLGTTASLSSTYYNIPSRGGLVAASNDDACNCDASQDYLITPMFDLTGATSAELVFDTFYNGDYGSTAHVRINDGSLSIVYYLPTAANWRTVNMNLSIFLGQPAVQVTFWHNDQGEWASGFAIDNVSVTPEPGALALLAMGGMTLIRRFRRR